MTVMFPARPSDQEDELICAALPIESLPLARTCMSPAPPLDRASVLRGREDRFQSRSGQHRVAPGFEFALGSVRQTLDHHRRQGAEASLELARKDSCFTGEPALLCEQPGSA